MSIELVAILATLGVQFAIVMVQQGYNDLKKGPMWALSNRSDQELDEVSARIGRTLANHGEGAALFVPLALCVAALDAASWGTAVGAQVFVVSRVAYSALYVFGVPYVRSAAWMAGVAGTAMVAWPLVGLAWAG